MAVAADIFGTAYLDAEAFRASAELFGAGMAMAEYPTASSEAKLTHVLQAASRTIDAFCGKVFTSGNITEQHSFDPARWQIPVNNSPVSSVVSCLIRYGIGDTITIDVANCYINNQKGYIEIAQDYFQTLISGIVPAALVDPQIEIVYKSLQTVPADVKLATGYQAAHLINTGFVDAVAPPNFGKLDLAGLSIGVSNKKGSRNKEEMQSAAICDMARAILQPHVNFVAG